MDEQPRPGTRPSGIRGLPGGLLGAIRRGAPVVAVCALLAPAAAYAAALAVEDEYTTTARIDFIDVELEAHIFDPDFPRGFPPPRRGAENRLPLLGIDIPLQRTADDLDEPSGVLGLATTTEAYVEGDDVVITVKDTVAAQAARVANALANQYVRFRQESATALLQRASGEVTRLAQRLSPLSTGQRVRIKRRQRELRALERRSASNARLALRAPVPQIASSPQPWRRALGGLAAGLALGVALALLSDVMRVRGPSIREASR